jgi:hypothetical protein
LRIGKRASVNLQEDAENGKECERSTDMSRNGQKRRDKEIEKSRCKAFIGPAGKLPDRKRKEDTNLPYYRC